MVSHVTLSPHDSGAGLVRKLLTPSASMSTTNSKKTSPDSSEIDVTIPEELEFFLSETAKDLEITPDELVRQAVALYSRTMKGGSRE
jgi:hypothetical protein